MNLNDSIWIKPTEHGLEVYTKYWEGVGVKNPEPLKLDFEGWTKMQLWEVMQIFGHAMYNGGKVPIETEIRLTNY
jgi:hypothetical protein